MTNNQLVYEISKWDEFQWTEFVETHPETQKTLLAAPIPEFNTFASEVFHVLYSPLPKRIEQPRPEALWAVKAHKEISESPDFDELKLEIELQSQGNSFKKRLLAGMGAVQFSSEIAQKLPSSQKNNFDNTHKLRQQAKAIANQVQSLQQLEQLNPQEEQLLSDLKSELAEINKLGKKAVARAQRFASSIETILPEAIASASQTAKQAISNIGETINSFGWGSETGQLTQAGSFEDTIKLAQELSSNAKLVRIALIAGRMKQLAAKKQRTKTNNVPQEPYTVEMGSNLNRVLPSELINLAIPELRPLFCKSYSENSLLQYKLRGFDTTVRGPIVICLDSSGSMEGHKEEWSKGVAIALLHLANSQKRDCRILHFDKEVRRIDDFPKGQIDTLKLKNSMLSFYRGGTSWQKPLDSAMEVIESSEYSRADIILITDGECAVESKWLERFLEKKKLQKVNLFGVLLGSTESLELDKIANQTIVLNSSSHNELMQLSENAKIEEIFTI